MDRTPRIVDWRRDRDPSVVTRRPEGVSGYQSQRHAYGYRCDRVDPSARWTSVATHRASIERLAGFSHQHRDARSSVVSVRGNRRGKTIASEERVGCLVPTNVDPRIRIRPFDRRRFRSSLFRRSRPSVLVSDAVHRFIEKPIERNRAREDRSVQRTGAPCRERSACHENPFPYVPVLPEDTIPRSSTPRTISCLALANQLAFDSTASRQTDAIASPNRSQLDRSIEPIKHHSPAHAFSFVKRRCTIYKRASCT